MLERLRKGYEYWVNLHPFVRLVLVFAILVGSVWYAGKPAYRKARYWWNGRQLDEAREAARLGMMDKARDLSQTLLRSGDPRVIEALRVLEQSVEGLQDPIRLDIARSLMSHPKGTRDDRLRSFRTIAASAPMGVAGQAWVNLQPADRASSEFAHPFADRLISDRMFREAAGVVGGVATWDRDWESQRRVIRILIGSGAGEDMEQAHKLLNQHWPKYAREGGIDLLEQIPVERLKPALLPNATLHLDPKIPREALALVRLDFAGDRSSRPAQIDKAVAAWRAAAPLELAAFLDDAGMHRRLMLEFPPTEAKLHPGMVARLIRAAAEELEWRLAGEYLAEGAAQLGTLERLAWKSAVLAKNGEGPDGEAAWREAMAEVRKQPVADQWLDLAAVMRAAGMRDRENQALLEAVLMGRGKLPLFKDLQPLMESLLRDGKEKVMIRACAIYLLLEPGNPVLLTHYAYLACVTNSCDAEMLAKAMEPLADAYESSPQIQCVLVAIHLARGAFGDAARRAVRVKVPVSSLPAGYRAAVLAARVEAGEIPSDDPVVAGFPWTGLSPVETRFYSKFFGSRDGGERVRDQ